MAFDVLAELEARADERPAVADAYAWCKGYAKARASNFYYAFAILPPEKRNAIYAAYAFSGYVDDIADELTERARQERELALARERLAACYAGERAGPLFTALGDAVERFPVPREYFEELVNGVEMDFTIDRYESWDDLKLYCYRVASMVGRICVAVFGAKPHPRADEFATSMGIGLQIVNIMRDVREDAERGRDPSNGTGSSGCGNGRETPDGGRAGACTAGRGRAGNQRRQTPAGLFHWGAMDAPSRLPPC